MPKADIHDGKEFAIAIYTGGIPTNAANNMIQAFVEVGKAVNDSERRAFETLREILEAAPDPYIAFTNILMPNGRNGYNELDAVVVGPSCIFAIEIKGWGGRIRCSRDHWYLDDGAVFENPCLRLSQKAKELKNYLASAHRALLSRLWVQDIVYVNGIGAQLAAQNDGTGLILETPANACDSAEALRAALLSPGRWLNKPQRLLEQVRTAAKDALAGGRKPQTISKIGKYLVLEELASTSDRFERLLARDRYDESPTPQLFEMHVYPLDGRRETGKTVQQAFKQQIEIVKALGNARVIPAYVHDDDAMWRQQRVRYIAYEWLGDARSLRETITTGRSEGLREKLAVAIALADAVGAIHEQGFVHGALEPSSIFVVPVAEGDGPRVVVGRVEVARPIDPELSISGVTTIGETASAYGSPEVLAGKRPRERDDIFSFGAILVHLLKGRPLFAGPNEILAATRLPRLLDDRSEDPPELKTLVADLLARSPANRPSSFDDVAAALRDILAKIDPKEPGVERIGNYRILRELRAGTTGRTVLAARNDLDVEVVLKIAKIGQDATLRHELEVLARVRDAHIVSARNGTALPERGEYVGEFDVVPGEDCQRLAGRSLEPLQIAGLADGLFAALAKVHAAGYVHRDVKPANVMLARDGTATLLDFGLASAPGDDAVVVGTAPYKPERLYDRGYWAFSDDVFAAIVTFWQTVTGRHPWGEREPRGEPTLQPDDLGTLLDASVRLELTDAVRQLLLATPEDRDAAVLVGRRLRSLLIGLTSVTLQLPLRRDVEVPATAQLDSPIRSIPLEARSYAALDDLGVTTLDDVRLLRVADVSRVRAFGRSVTDELLTLVDAVERRFGPLEPSHASRLRSIVPAFAPALVASGDAQRDTIAILSLATWIEEALVAQGVVTVAQLAGTNPTSLERDERIGTAGVGLVRTALERYANDREEFIIEQALPPWRFAQRAAFVEGVQRLGGDESGAIVALEVAGGFEVHPSDAPGLAHELVFAPPWTHAAASSAIAAVVEALAWPPREPVVFAEVLARVGPSAADASAAVERLLHAIGGADATRDGRWYRGGAPTTADLLRYGSDGIALPATLAAFVAAVRARLPQATLPPITAREFEEAIDAAGFIVQVDGRVQLAAAVATEATLTASDLTGAEAIGTSAAARALCAVYRGNGGYRLVVAEPGRYVKRVAALVEELRRELGAETVRAIDFDRELVRRCEERNVLEAALRVQPKRSKLDGSLELVVGEIADAILDELIVPSRRGCTILVNAGGLALTGRLQRLGRIYDRARGGSFGLVVACIPGDHPRERARFNRELAAPTPATERPIALEEAA